MGERQPLILKQKRIIWQDLFRKLRENERNWTEGRFSIAPPSLGSANVLSACSNEEGRVLEQPYCAVLNDARVTRATKVKFNKHVICQHNVTAIKTHSLTGDKRDLPALHRDLTTSLNDTL